MAGPSFDSELAWPDGWDRAAQWTMAFCGLMYLLLAPTTAWLMTLDPEMPDSFGWFFGAIMLLVCGGVAAVNFAAAWGIGSRKKWAWFVTVGLGFLYVPSICMPFGAVMVYAMMRPRGMAAFGISGSSKPD